jgi:hypothetical protein
VRARGGEHEALLLDFQNHSAGWLFLIVVICFFGMEIVQFFRQRGWRKDATRIAPGSFWVGV